MSPPGNDKPKIIVICGPTAIGKTSIAIEMAEALGGEIVSADSMQIYTYMDIGTAKPSPDERRRVAHHMIDIAGPDEPYDAARFSREARTALQSIFARGRLPLVAGGTGFYIKALLYGLCDAVPEDESVRQRLKAEAAQSGSEALHHRLAACDPDAAGNIHPNDAYRIIRALAVYETSGMSLTAFRRRHAFSEAPYDVLKIGLYMDRQALYGRIEQRVDQMIADGLFEEVMRLLDMGYPETLRPMQALGYRHMAAFIRGETDWATAIETLKRDTRQYAKRQLTWFRRDPEIIWFDRDRITGMIECVKHFLCV